MEDWWMVHVATLGDRACFRDEEDARGYADALRDVIGEARGTSAVHVRQLKRDAKTGELR